MMSEPRIPARIEVQALLRQVQSAGGFGTVLHKGEPDSGALLVVATGPGEAPRAWERMPAIDGTRSWYCCRRAESPDFGKFSAYLERRSQQDPDVWIIELDIPQAERFIGEKGAAG